MMIAADIGGTMMRVATGEANGTLLDVRYVDTPITAKEGIDILASEISQLKDAAFAECAVIGIAGVLDSSRKGLAWSPHLKGWTGVDLAAALQTALGIPVSLENDAALGALGEARLGAGAQSAVLAYVAVGTGIGGARIVDGKIDRNAFGFEIGHQYLAFAEGTEFEQLVSGAAISLERGTAAKDITDPAIWDEYARLFSFGLYNSILHWSPDTVVLGGSLIGENGMQIASIGKHLDAINRALPRLPNIMQATLEYPGLVGGLITGTGAAAYS